MSSDSKQPTWFQRFILPGLAFKAVIIGGGYATGRELAEFFLPSGPRNGLIGMLLAAGIWSVVCALTFLFARLTNSIDYRDFFRHLLGRFWIAFELTYSALIIVMLSVFGAAAGTIEGSSAKGWNTHDRAIVRAMEELHFDSMISDDTWADLAEFFNDKKLIELVILAGQYKTVAYYQNALRLPLPESNLGLLAR